MMQQQMASLMKLVQEQEERLQREESKSSQGVKPSPSRTFNCYSCGREGHVSTNCPDRKMGMLDSKTMEKRKVNCYACGHEGHVQSRCPEKKNRDSRERSQVAGVKNNSSSEKDPSDAVRKVGRTLYIPGSIQGQRVECLIDTGSEVNLLPADLLKQAEMQPSSRVLQAANGSQIGVLGEVMLPVRLAKMEMLTNFIVSDQIDEVLLGVGWLQENKCCIYFDRGAMSVQGTNIPLIKRASNMKCNRIILQETVEVPASSEVNVYGKIVYANLSTSNSGSWATKPRECKPGIHVACSLIPDKSINVPVRVLNVKDEPQCMEKGMCLTSMQEVTLMEEAKEEDQLPTERRKKIQEQINEVVNQMDSEIGVEDKQRFKALLEEYQDIISSDEYDLGRTDLVEHCIDTGNARPVRQTLRRMPAAYANIIDEQIKLMLKQGIIQPAVSEWSSNVVLVKKKDQSWRFCVDFRGLNEKCVRDAQPIPRIDSCLEALAGSAWFSTLDMRSGFFQVKIREEDASENEFHREVRKLQLSSYAHGFV